MPRLKPVPGAEGVGGRPAGGTQIRTQARGQIWSHPGPREQPGLGSPGPQPEAHWRDRLSRTMLTVLRITPFAMVITIGAVLRIKVKVLGWGWGPPATRLPRVPSSDHAPLCIWLPCEHQAPTRAELQEEVLVLPESTHSTGRRAVGTRHVLA